MRASMQKSISTQNISRSKRAGSMHSSSMKVANTNFKFREPFFAPLNKISEEMEKNCQIFLKKWSEKRTLSPPKRRSFHTSCIYEDYFYIFGGKDITEGKLSDIMRVKLTEDNPQWEKIFPSNNINLEPLAYHTGTQIDDKYYIIGGNDKYIRQSPFIYIYDLKNNTLEKIQIEKDTDICYLSMHTANYYQPTNEIILFGGYSEGEMLNTIFRFNIETTKITKIDNLDKDQNSIPLPRTGHTSCIHNNYLYVFGGSIKDGGLLNDFWKLNLENFTWEQIISNDNNNESNNELVKPSPRSGHSLLLLLNNEIYIFGGKIGNFQEGNDLWKYDINSNAFTLLHDTFLEQFTDEEIEEFKKEEDQKKNKKGSDFHFITKKEIDDKINPFSKLYQERKIKHKLFKSKSTMDLNINDYENEIFVNPGYYQMKHSSIFNLDNKDISSAILALDMLLPYKIGEKGIRIPLPRDGQSLNFYEKGNKLVIFGGDRNKYPFNDLYFFNLD